MAERKYTEARKANNRKWDAANLDRMSLALPKGSRDKIKEYADKAGESMNVYIQGAIAQRMERERIGATLDGGGSDAH